MGNAIVVKTIEELSKYHNGSGVIEVVLRDKQKKYVAFQKLILKNISENESKNTALKVIEQLNKHSNLAKKSFKLINNLAKMQQLSLILGSLNLCATCIGFAIMYAKLDKISGQINQLMNVVKQEHEIQTDYEFKKVLSEHANMLDCRKTRKYYTEEQMRKLVDDEYNVLCMLIEVFTKDLSTEPEGLIFSIYSLASMLSVSLRYFDELYYFNNKEAIADGDVWHSSHSNWMSVFDKLTSPEFIKKIQDHGIFDLNLSTEETDIYYISLYDQARSMVEDVSDNQKLIQLLDNQEVLAEVQASINQSLVDEIEKTINEVPEASEQEEFVETYQETIKQMGLAV